MNGDTERLHEAIEGLENEMVSFLSDIVSIPAISPLSGGSGEAGKAELIMRYLERFGLSTIRRHDAPDTRVPGGFRPNIEVSLEGASHKCRIVVIAHMDVVPPGDESLWDGDPFTARIENGRLVGRGVEDNGQAITAMVFALKALADTGTVPACDISLYIVSDEEETNEMGISYLVGQGCFTERDLIVVADHGNPEGTFIETMEKTLLWVKVSVLGTQCHASVPDEGTNAVRASMLFGVRADRELHRLFPEEDPFFGYPRSSFEPTRRETSVTGINIIPGTDVFYIDCRLLPCHNPKDVLEALKNVARAVGEETGAKVSVEQHELETTLHQTPPDAPVVGILAASIKIVTGLTPTVGGIGGGTCAAVIRNSGLHAAVWETVDNRAHTPNEYIKIRNMVQDCKVFATMFLLGVRG